MHEYFGGRNYCLRHQRFSEIILGKRSPKITKVDSKKEIQIQKQQLPEKVCESQKFFRKKTITGKKLANL
jgi:hypothetical protein